MGVLDGRSALVTGGGSGIGFACAQRLAADGAIVTICGRSEDRLNTAVVELGPEASFVACDVTAEDQVAAAVAHATDNGGGRLDIVVASAGTGSLNRIEDVSLDEWRGVVDVVLTGAFLTIKHAVAPMAAGGGGSMVAVSSIAGDRPHRFMGPYSVAKAGLDMLVRVAADELGDRGIRVNSVRPGLTDTDLVSMITADETMRSDYLSQMPVRRVGTVDDVAALVRFLCGPESGWITGATVPVDGGHHLRRGPDYTPWVAPRGAG